MRLDPILNQLLLAALTLLEIIKHLKIKRKNLLYQWWEIKCHKITCSRMLWEEWVWEWTCLNNRWDMVAWTKECNLNLEEALAHNLKRTNLEVNNSINNRIWLVASSKHNNHLSRPRVPISTNRSSNQWIKGSELSNQQLLPALTRSKMALWT